ncbi:MAG: ABC transporter permease [Deltaproteobacteria bacterium]|nr:MAG: ABC transporter permease [Deltaproteobacteria bacterium]
MRKRFKPFWGVVPILLFLSLWEVVVRLGLVPGRLFFPPFSSVLEEFYSLVVEGPLLRDFLSSLFRVLVGFSAGSIAGLLMGVLMGWKEVADRWLSPIISLLYPIPALGWLPLLMLWIGVNELLPIAVIFICSFFPVLYNTLTGIRGVDREVIKAARVLGASRWRTLTRVVIPLALPNIFTGLRLEAGMAWRVIIAAEMVAIPTGIGALMMRAESLMRVDVIIVCLGVLSLVCFTFERIFLYLERRLTYRWR